MPRLLTAAFLLSITMVLGCQQQQSAGPGTESGSTVAVEETGGGFEMPEPVIYSEPATLVFNVPEMMCPHGCYPAIKEVLAQQENVEGIELGTPAEEKADEIKDRRVVITTNGPFNATDVVSLFPPHLQEGVTIEKVDVAATTEPESAQADTGEQS